MSKMMLRSNGKPPLARSPIRLRPSRPLQSSASNTAQIPPGSFTKSQMPKRSWDVEELELRPEYSTISCELRALAKMVRQEFGTSDENMDAEFDNGVLSTNRSPLFERGRFYEEYSARRNERLKRKKGEVEGHKKKPTNNLGVRIESAKKFDSGRRMAVAATPMMVQREAATPRYSLRSSTRKENKKPPLPMNVENSVGYTERKVGGRRIRKT
ncbi:uncharacterized protein LOC111392842 [Olea europaea var. sylvestris]|uniref:uncharacterized protein LOC111392842 n=1 Tax=Olea europaea var. sylvestris TaxID=158386 RepID=UPI000C1CEEBD|nr:uncharacterized protein LOC111392842 [Olea europaea var. sylvestris]